MQAQVASGVKCMAHPVTPHDWCQVCSVGGFVLTPAAIVFPPLVDTEDMFARWKASKSEQRKMKNPGDIL